MSNDNTISIGGHTRLFDNGDIEQTETHTFNGVLQETHRQVLRTKDKQVREALIELGWTPPQDDVSKESLDLLGAIDRALRYAQSGHADHVRLFAKTVLPLLQELYRYRCKVDGGDPEQAAIVRCSAERALDAVQHIVDQAQRLEGGHE